MIIIVIIHESGIPFLRNQYNVMTGFWTLCFLWLVIEKSTHNPPKNSNYLRHFWDYQCYLFYQDMFAGLITNWDVLVKHVQQEPLESLEIKATRIMMKKATSYFLQSKFGEVRALNASGLTIMYPSSWRLKCGLNMNMWTPQVKGYHGGCGQ